MITNVHKQQRCTVIAHSSVTCGSIY